MSNWGLLQDRVAKLMSRVAVIDRDLRDARERLEELSTTLTERMDGVEGQVRTIGEQVTGIDQKVDAVYSYLVELLAEVRKLHGGS